MSEFKSKLKAKFSDKEYAHAYVQSHIVNRIAAQILVLRKSKHWTQKQLAEVASIPQEKISKYENADFSSLTLRTLYKLAEAFDVSLEVAFTEFSKTIEDIEAFSEQILQVTDRVSDIESFSYAVPDTYPQEKPPLDVRNMHSIRVQSPIEVMRDIHMGQNSTFYVSLDTNNRLNTYETQTLPEKDSWFSIIPNIELRKIEHG